VNNVSPTIMQSLSGFIPKEIATTPKRVYKGDTAEINFLGVDLTVEVDNDGRIEGILSPDGSELYCAFQDWVLTDIERLVKKQAKQNYAEARYDIGADRYADRMSA